MDLTVSRRRFGRVAAASCVGAGMLLAGCGNGGGDGAPKSFQPKGNGAPAAAPTNVTGKSDTSGIGAGTGLQVAGATPSPQK